MWIAALCITAIILARWLTHLDRQAHQPDPTPAHTPRTVRVIPPIHLYDQDSRQ